MKTNGGVEEHIHHLRPPHSMEVCQIHSPAALNSSITWEIGWAPETVWTLWSREESFVLAGNRSSTVQPVARRYID
jgi:hypothetical protein